MCDHCPALVDLADRSEGEISLGVPRQRGMWRGPFRCGPGIRAGGRQKFMNARVEGEGSPKKRSVKLICGGCSLEKGGFTSKFEVEL